MTLRVDALQMLLEFTRALLLPTMVQTTGLRGRRVLYSTQ